MYTYLKAIIFVYIYIYMYIKYIDYQSAFFSNNHPTSIQYLENQSIVPSELRTQDTLDTTEVEE